MKLTCKSAPLISALDTASLAISGNRNMPALTCALVTCRKDGSVTVACDSMDARIEIDFIGAEVDEDHSFLVAPRLMKSALRSEDAEIVFKDEKLTIKSGGKTSLFTLPVKEFPNPWEKVGTNPVDAVRFLGALKMASACSGPPYESVSWDKDTTRLFGTNGKGFVASEVDLQLTDSFILPSGQTKIITSCFDADELEAGLLNQKLFLNQNNRRAWIKTVEGNLLPHKSLLIDCLPMASVGREELKSAMDALTDFVESDFQKITITPQDGKWAVSSTSSNGNSSVVVDDVENGQDGEAFTLARHAVANVIRFWNSDRITVSKQGGILMLKPEGEEGIIGICSLYRNEA